MKAMLILDPYEQRRLIRKRRASGADNGASTDPGRRTTAMGMLAAISRQRRQRANCTRLSEPISQMKCTSGKRLLSARTVSTV